MTTPKKPKACKGVESFQPRRDWTKQENVFMYGERSMRKALLRLTADTLQKLAIVGIGLGVFQSRTDGIWYSVMFLAGSYLLTILLEAKK